MTDSRACQRLEIDRCRTTRWSGPSLGAPRIRELISWAAQLGAVSRQGECTDLQRRESDNKEGESHHYRCLSGVPRHTCGAAG